MQNEPLEEEEQEIVEQVDYLKTVLIPSIRAINNAIENEKTARASAKNLITDLLPEWKAEIKKELDGIELAYQKTTKYYNENAMKLSHRRSGLIEADQDYSRGIKEAIIVLLHKKIGLFKTRRKVETGAIDLWEVMGKKEREDIDD